MSTSKPFSTNPDWSQKDNEVAFKMYFMKSGEEISYGDITDSGYDALGPVKDQIVQKTRTDPYSHMSNNYNNYRYYKK